MYYYIFVITAVFPRTHTRTHTFQNIHFTNTCDISGKTKRVSVWYLCLADRKQALPRLAGEDLYIVTTWQRTNFFRPRQRVLLAGRLQGDPRSSHSPPRRRNPGVRQSRSRSGSHHIHGSERQRRLSPETPQRHLAILLCADV